jgi:hypothetical protein
VGALLNSDLKIRSGSHEARLHGQNSQLTMDFDSLSSIRHLQKQLPRLVPIGEPVSSTFNPVTIAVKVRGRQVATVIMQEGRLFIRRHWLAIFRSLLP